MRQHVKGSVKRVMPRTQAAYGRKMHYMQVGKGLRSAKRATLILNVPQFPFPAASQKVYRQKVYQEKKSMFPDIHEHIYGVSTCHS